MDGWNFLSTFEDLLPYLTKQIDIFIITSSINPNDRLRSQAYRFVQGFFSKPLTVEILLDISNIITTNSIMRHNLGLLSSTLTDLSNLSDVGAIQEIEKKKHHSSGLFS
jgi:hypothetical protein